MTIERLFDELQFNQITTKEANEFLQSKENKKKINSLIHRDKYNTLKMNDSELGELNALVNILQMIYNSGTESFVSDENYDILQEMLVNEGVPRLTGSFEFNSRNKSNHKYTQLRGTLDKIYYLTSDEERINPSRKYLDDWKKTTETKYFKITGKKIDLDDYKVAITPKFDGCSCILEINNHDMKWLTRGDTGNNEATDVTLIMKQFNDIYANYNNCGIKFEIMMSEGSKDELNRLYHYDNPYKNSRSIVSAILNSSEPDFRVKYLYPVPLRIIQEDENIETITSELLTRFPSMICKLSEREKIREFAMNNKYVIHNSHQFRTDGVVLTLVDKHLQEVLGRESNINLFEVAYKFTEEIGKTKIKDIEFYVSEFGYITPVAVVKDIKLKGNVINKSSISNRERFDELHLAKDDEVIIRYDIIPYLTLNEKCKRSGRPPIKFIDHCPKCGSVLDLTPIQVKCTNDECECRIVGRILNYCTTLRMKNIGYSTIETLWNEGLLKKGIKSLYNLRKKTLDIEFLDGFGKLKTSKIIKEIESKRRLKDYEFFGAYGIEGLSTKTFQIIFSNIKFSDFCEYIGTKNTPELYNRLVKIPGIGDKKADTLISYFKKKNHKKYLDRVLDEVRIIETFGEEKKSKGIIVFSNFRSKETKEYFESIGYTVSENWTNKASYVITPTLDKITTKIEKANALNIPVVLVTQSKEVIR